MKKIVLLLFLMFFSMLVFAQAQEKVLVLSLNYSKEKLSFENAFIQKGVFGSTMKQGKISGKIYSADGKGLFTFKFDLDNKIAVESIGTIKEDPFKQVLVLPYFEEAEKIVFFNEETKQELIVSIAFLAKLCDNNICNASESFGNCPEDCPSGSKDSYCDRKEDNVCDADCKPEWLDKDCKPELYQASKAELTPEEIDNIVKKTIEEKQAPQDYFWAMGIITIIAAAGIALLFWKNKKN